MSWHSIDDTPLTRIEREMGSAMRDIANTATVQMHTLDDDLQIDTTLLVLHRPTETLLLSIRSDGSVVIASDVWPS
jgi:hypothetical protein